MKNGAFEEFQAPYVGSDLACQTKTPLALHQNQAGSSFGMHGWETLPKNKYEPLMRALAEKGPTAVSVDATPFHMYQNGIFDGCSKDAIINHAVAAVGYGQDAKGRLPPKQDVKQNHAFKKWSWAGHVARMNEHRWASRMTAWRASSWWSVQDHRVSASRPMRPRPGHYTRWEAELCKFASANGWGHWWQQANESSTEEWNKLCMQFSKFSTKCLRRDER